MMKANKAFLKFSNLKLYFWSSLWLMFILILGTIKQKEIGLYRSQQLYFDSWYFMQGNIPLPGGKLTLAIIFWGLLYQLIFKTNYLNKRKTGIAITHFGVMFLFVGSIITNLTNIEGSMIIPEGKTTNYFQDYHVQEMAITRGDESLASPNMAIEENKLKPDLLIVIHDSPIRLKILNYYKNVEIKPRTKNDNIIRLGFSSRFEVLPVKESSNENENVPAVEFEILGTEAAGIYVIYKDMPVIQKIKTNDGREWKLELRNLRHYLPFSITLTDFEKKYYPSSQIPKSFKSDIILHDKKIDQNIVIKMNEPLRYKGYTFYQSSFSENSEGEVSDLAVVKNAGKYFPYISSIIICIGIMIHLILNMSSFFHSESKDE